MTFSDMRTLAPSTISAFSRDRLGGRRPPARSRCCRARRPGTASARYWRYARRRRAACGSAPTMKRRKAAKLFAPASPAETQVVVHLVGDELVGRNADGRAVRINVAVQIDEARRHQLAGGIEHAQRARRRRYRPRPPRSRHSGCRCRACRAAIWLGSSTSPPLMSEVELVVRPHHGMRAGDAGSNGKRCSRSEKRAA